MVQNAAQENAGMALKAAALKTMRPGRHPDGRYGLYFNVAGNSRTWVQRLTVDGKRRNFGVGPWPVVSLSETREIAFENVRKRQRGINLVTGRKRARTVPTFAAAADAYIALQAPGWKAGCRNESNWRSSLAHAAAIADRPVDAITTDDVLAVVRVGGEVGRFRSLAGAAGPGRERRRWPMRAGSSARRSSARVRPGPVVLPGGGRPASGGPRQARHRGDPRPRDDDARRGGVRLARGLKRNAPSLPQRRSEAAEGAFRGLWPGGECGSDGPLNRPYAQQRQGC